MCQRQAAVGRGNHGVGALGHDHHAAGQRQRHGALDLRTCPIEVPGALHRQQLAFVRGGDQRGLVFGQQTRSQQHQRIGIEHCGDLFGQS